MIDRLRQMAIFAKTIDHGSFRAAADALRISPSVVSNHISQLEEHLGVALLYRSTRKLRLTEEGKRLLAASHKMLDAVEGELQALSSVADTPSGELRITAPSVLANSPFTERVAAFLGANPRVRLSLDFSDERRKIIDGGYDIAIRMALSAKPSATTRKLFQVQRLLVASPEFLAAQTEANAPSDLRDWTWLELAPVRKESITFRRGQSKQTVQPKTIQASCNDALALYHLARAGVGLAIIPEFLATQDADDGHIVTMLPDWTLDPIEAFAEWPSNAPKHGLVKLFVDFLSNPQTR